MKKCLVIGATMLDIILEVNSLPQKGKDIYAKNQSIAIGGCAYNVANIMKILDIPYTLFSPIGTGIYSNIIQSQLNTIGLQSLLTIDNSDNGYCLCLVEKDGERTFITIPGIESSFQENWFNQIFADDYSSVYVCGYELEGEGGEHIISFLEKHKTLTIYYAPGPRITHISLDKQKRIMNLHPILHLNELESIEYTHCDTYKNAAKSLAEITKNSVIITRGKKGAYLYENGIGISIPAHKTKVIDTIGAGDSHIGAIIASEMKGNNLERSIQFANKISAIVVGVKGPSITKNYLHNLKF